MKYFDIHAHIQFDDFDQDREEVIQRAQYAEVGMINIATGLETSKQSIELAEKYDDVYAAVGLHPIYIKGGREGGEEMEFEAMRELIKHPKVVTIGECGIDLFHNKAETLNQQIEVFEKHIQLAQESDKPLMFHIRNAYTQALEVLKKYPKVKGNAHFFAGTIEEARAFFDLGHTLSFTGAITYKNSESYAEIIKYAPLNMIMAETDCPYVAPVPYRGKRNEPSYVVEVYKKIAEIKGLSLDKVATQLRENVKRVFRI